MLICNSLKEQEPLDSSWDNVPDGTNELKQVIKSIDDKEALFNLSNAETVRLIHSINEKLNINNPTQLEQIKKIANHYGEHRQITKTIEECGELIQALSKHIFNDYSQHVIEEIADVEIMLQQIKYLMNVGVDVAIVKQNKIERTLKRMRS